MRLLPLLFLTACLPAFQFVDDEDQPDESDPDLTPRGYFVGDVVPDWQLQNQDNETISLWSFEGDWILLELTTMWASPGHESAEEAQRIQEDYRDRGLSYVMVLQENIEGDPASVDDAVMWAEAFGLVDVSVLADSTGATDDALDQGHLPAAILINPEMEVVERDEPTWDVQSLRVMLDLYLPREN